jgi:uncharacterized coiled-coil DUF342 family protein
MSLEDMVEEFSKKWKVSKEEAEKRIRKFLEKMHTSDKTPTPENIFPEPIGEISRKIQDINQAALSTAYTQRLLSRPPEDIQALREKLEKIDSIIAEVKAGLEDRINKLTEMLEDRIRKEHREELLKELDSKIEPVRQSIQSLAQKLEELEKLGREEKPTQQTTPAQPESILEQAEKVVEDAKRWLQKTGYTVEPERISRSEVQKMIEEAQKRALESIPAEEMKKRLEQIGYKVVGGPVRWEDVEKAIEEAKKKAKEEALEDKRIEVAASILRDGITKVIEIFRPAIETYLLQGAGQQRSSLGESQASAGS